eukprot:CAMPEP_0119565886 /NCGR_PEP_ID=MMETSP1352-20130426/31429_1 /TAXON_ID=265584 /ORGANISM="Stauroneis constricta, Strain CCMP1120" /LENGTH=487 /DNA_ID=CAMNT_0007614901 /DNA_START=1 /DNA_END=1460 /DNA_ORIENTATION=-
MQLPPSFKLPSTDRRVSLHSSSKPRHQDGGGNGGTIAMTIQQRSYKLKSLAFCLAMLAFMGMCQMIAFHRFGGLDGDDVNGISMPAKKAIANPPKAARSVVASSQHPSDRGDHDDDRWWWQLDEYKDPASVTFTRWNGTEAYGWCGLENTRNYGKAENNNNTDTGFYFVKTYKTGSSTGVGVHLHISHSIARRHFAKSRAFSCAHDDFLHLFSTKRKHLKRNKAKSFVWTIVRNPQRRALSAFHYYIVGAMNHTNATTEDLLQYLHQSKNYQTTHLMNDSREIQVKNGVVRSRSIIPSKYFQSKQDLANLIHTKVLGEYNFVAVLERWEESVVALQLLLDLEDEDVMVNSAKASGGWSWDWNRGESCFQIPQTPKVLPSSVTKYLETTFWKDNADFLLHEAAMKSLDNTIELLGRDVFEKKLQQHREMKAFIQQQCSDVKFPCSSDGVFQPKLTRCYFRDMGCGYPCVIAAASQNEEGSRAARNEIK